MIRIFVLLDLFYPNSPSNELLRGYITYDVIVALFLMCLSDKDMQYVVPASNYLCVLLHMRF